VALFHVGQLEEELGRLPAVSFSAHFHSEASGGNQVLVERGVPAVTIEGCGHVGWLDFFGIEVRRVAWRTCWGRCVARAHLPGCCRLGVGPWCVFLR
jgi:hypothetical protein